MRPLLVYGYSAILSQRRGLWERVQQYLVDIKSKQLHSLTLIHLDMVIDTFNGHLITIARVDESLDYITYKEL
jgi:hypothetical protein